MEPLELRVTVGNIEAPGWYSFRSSLAASIEANLSGAGAGSTWVVDNSQTVTVAVGQQVTGAGVLPDTAHPT
jgi:hypothetical protein